MITHKQNKQYYLFLQVTAPKRVWNCECKQEEERELAEHGDGEFRV